MDEFPLTTHCRVLRMACIGDLQDPALLLPALVELGMSHTTPEILAELNKLAILDLPGVCTLPGRHLPPDQAISPSELREALTEECHTAQWQKGYRDAAAGRNQSPPSHYCGLDLNEYNRGFQAEVLARCYPMPRV